MSDIKPKITLPKKQYMPEYGDIDVYGEYCKYLEKVDWELFRTMNPMPILGIFSSNPWNAMLGFGIDKTSVENLKQWSRNYCPCSDMNYNSIVPVSILTSDADRYIGGDKAHWFYDLLSDGDWNRYQNWGISNEDSSKDKSRETPEDYLSTVSRAILGSGYTECILPSDGGHDLIFAMIPLDNGDKIVTIGWEWYNK